jgi:hypothetical protein
MRNLYFNMWNFAFHIRNFAFHIMSKSIVLEPYNRSKVRVQKRGKVIHLFLYEKCFFLIRFFFRREGAKL